MSPSNEGKPGGRGESRTAAGFRILACVFSFAVCLGSVGCLDCNPTFPMTVYPSEVTRGVETEFKLEFDRDLLDPSKSAASQTVEVMLISRKAGTQSMVRFASWSPELSPEFKSLEIVDARTVRFVLTVPSDFDTGAANLGLGAGSASTCESKGGNAIITIR